MGLFLRRHRGSQTGAPTPVVSISPPGTLTARQAIIEAMKWWDESLTPDQWEALSDAILLSFDEHGMAVVASSEVEDAPEVLGRARPDRPQGW